MARTLGGRYTGMAARIDRSDRLAEMLDPGMYDSAPRFRLYCEHGSPKEECQKCCDHSYELTGSCWFIAGEVFDDVREVCTKCGHEISNKEME
jgi:hypothetical protein